MKVGEGLDSEGMLSSVLRVQACSRVLGYSSLKKKYEILMLKVAMTGQDGVV